MALAAACALPIAGCDASQAVPGVSSTLKSSLTNFAGQNKIPTQRYFRNGVWTTTDVPGDWEKTNAGPPLAAARLWAATGKTDAVAFGQAVSTFETAMATKQAATACSGPTRSRAPGSPTRWGRPTCAQGPPLAGPAERVVVLDRPRRGLPDHEHERGLLPERQHRAVLRRAVLPGLRGHGRREVQTAYNKALANAYRPRQDMYPGRGWVQTKAATKADGSDGSGYFTEEGSGGVGFDAEYTMAQLDVAANLWLASKDPRALVHDQRAAQPAPAAGVRPDGQPAVPRATTCSTPPTGRATPRPAATCCSTRPRSPCWPGAASARSSWRCRSASSPTSTPTSARAGWPSNPVHYADLGRDVGAMLMAAVPSAQPAPR